MSFHMEVGDILFSVWIPLVSKLALAWASHFLAAQYLVNQWLDSYHIFIYDQDITKN